MRIAPKPPGKISDLERLNNAATNRWFEERDPIEGSKMMSSDCRMIGRLREWTSYLEALIKYCRLMKGDSL